MAGLSLVTGTTYLNDDNVALIAHSPAHHTLRLLSWKSTFSNVNDFSSVLENDAGNIMEHYT